MQIENSALRLQTGTEQRFVLTGMAARLNEIKQRRNFSVTHFPGVAACGFRPAWKLPCNRQGRGRSGGLAILVYVTRLGDL